MEAKPYKIPHPFRKLNKDLIDIIVKDIGEGSTHKLASQANGITPRILQIWFKQGEIDIEHEQESLCAYLVRSLARIKQIEVKMCRQVIFQSEKGHAGAEWTLEHAYWREFSSNTAAIELAEDIDSFSAHQLKGDQDGKIDNGETQQNSEK